MNRPSAFKPHNPHLINKLAKVENHIFTTYRFSSGSHIHYLEPIWLTTTTDEEGPPWSCVRTLNQSFVVLKNSIKIIEFRKLYTESPAQEIYAAVFFRSSIPAKESADAYDRYKPMVPQFAPNAHIVVTHDHIAKSLQRRIANLTEQEVVHVLPEYQLNLSALELPILY